MHDELWAKCFYKPQAWCDFHLKKMAGFEVSSFLFCIAAVSFVFGEWWPYTVLRLIPFILCFDFVTSCGFELGGTCVPDMASKESYNKKNNNL